MRILLLTPLLLIGCGTAPWIDNTPKQTPQMVWQREQIRQSEENVKVIQARSLETWKLACAKHQPEQEFPCELASHLRPNTFSDVPEGGYDIPRGPSNSRTISTPQGTYQINSGGGRTHIYRAY